MELINGVEVLRDVVLKNADGSFATFKPKINVETLAATRTLLTTDYIVQWLNPNGVSRDVVLSAEASSTNLMFIILNTGTTAAFNLVIKNAAAAVKATLGPGMMGMFSCDGTNWKWENATEFKTDMVSRQTILPLVNDAAKPTLAFGDGDTGFYEVSDDVVALALAGVEKVRFQANGLELRNNIGGDAILLKLSDYTGVANQTVGLQFLNTSTDITGAIKSKLYTGGDNGDLTFWTRYNDSLLQKMVITNVGKVGIITPAPSIDLAIADDDTGLDLAAADSLSIVAGGVEGHRITEAAGLITHNLVGSVVLSSGSTLEKAMSGDIVLGCSPATAGTSAATLNGAAAGAHTQVVTINLKDAAAALHKWASLAVNAATSEGVADVDVAAPAVSDATPDLAAGTINVTLTYDTDAGVTKTYAAGDTVTLTISQPTGGILGYPIANATFVDTIVA